MSAFADTSALYALLVGSEAGHEQVAAAFEDLLASGRPLITTNYVLLETTALLQRRIGLAAVRDLSERIVPVLTLRWISEALHHRALTRLVRADRRGLSLVDCTSFETMEREGLREVLALDADFADMGFRLLPELP